MMQSLGIATVPTAKELKALRMTPCLVIQDEIPAHYCYSADLITSGSGSVTSALLQKAEQVVPPQVDIMKPEDLHCTMYYKHTTGPDTKYEKQFLKIKQSTIRLKDLYWDKSGNYGASCTLSQELQSLYKNWETVPHVSLAKDKSIRWEDFGNIITRAEAASDWRDEGSGQVEPIYGTPLQFFEPAITSAHRSPLRQWQDRRAMRNNDPDRRAGERINRYSITLMVKRES